MYVRVCVTYVCIKHVCARVCYVCAIHKLRWSCYTHRCKPKGWNTGSEFAFPHDTISKWITQLFTAAERLTKIRQMCDCVCDNPVLI